MGKRVASLGLDGSLQQVPRLERVKRAQLGKPFRVKARGFPIRRKRGCYFHGLFFGNLSNAQIGTQPLARSRN